MVWRIEEKYTSGSKAFDANPYATDVDALKIIKNHWDRGLIESASMQDHDYNRIEWPEIKCRLGLP